MGDILAIVASVGICLTWIELIFLFGRYPSLGGCFSIILGTIIMINLIVAIIITDIEWLNKVSKLQVLRNQAHHAVQIHALQSMFKCLSSKVQDRSLSRQLEMSVCVHRVCKCGKMRTDSDTRDKLMDIVNMRH